MSPFRMPIALGLALSAGLAVSTMAGACFDPPDPACAFVCGSSGQCPDGYRCTADERCKRDDLPADYECQDFEPAPDAMASPDAADSADAADAADPADPADAAQSVSGAAFPNPKPAAFRSGSSAGMHE